MDFSTLATDEQIERAQKALKENGINSVVVSTGKEARHQVLSMIPKGAEAMDTSSLTLETIGLMDALGDITQFNSVKARLKKMDRATQGSEMQKIGAAPVWVVGSVHAVTEDGKVVIASNTGSQLPAYSYASQHVIWVVGTQKIVPDLDSAIKRVYDYVLPKESKHMQEKYGAPGSFVSKLLIINREVKPDRITIIFVKESLGY